MSTRLTADLLAAKHNSTVDGELERVSNCQPRTASPMAQRIKNQVCKAGDLGDGFDPWVEKIPLEEARATPLQYSCLKNPMDRGDWWATVPRVTKSWTRLND